MLVFNGFVAFADVFDGSEHRTRYRATAFPRRVARSVSRDIVSAQTLHVCQSIDPSKNTPEFIGEYGIHGAFGVAPYVQKIEHNQPQNKGG